MLRNMTCVQFERQSKMTSQKRQYPNSSRFSVQSLPLAVPSYASDGCNKRIIHARNVHSFHNNVV